MDVTPKRLESLSVYQALPGLLLLGVWLIAAEDVLLDGLLSSSLSNGSGFHPTSFVAFTAVFLLAILRRGRTGVWASGRGVVFGTYLVTVALGLLVLGRGLQLGLGLPLTGLDALLGEVTAPSYSSFATLFLLWLLHGADAHWPKRSRGTLAWANYALFSVVLALTLHQISDIVDLRGHEYQLPGMSVLSASLLLSLTAFIFPEAPATTLLFDRRAPKSNAASAGNLLVILGVLFLLERFVPYPGVALSLAGLMLIGLPLLVAAFRPLEIDARIKRGELVEEEEDLSADAGLGITREEVLSRRKPEGLLERSIYWATFEASSWQRLAVQGFWTFTLAYGAILISRQAEDAIASIWWANGYLANCLLLYPRAQWFKPLLTFYGSVLLANVLAGNSLVASTILTVVNTLEGAVLALAGIVILRVRWTLRYVTVIELQQNRLLLSIGSFLFIGLFSGILGGSLVTYLSGGSLGQNVYAWASGSIMGTFTMSLFGLGKLMEFHWGYKRLGPARASFPFLAILYLLLVAGLYAFLPPPTSIAPPHILFMALSLPLALLPSLLQAGGLLLVASTVYFYFTTTRWVIETIPFQFPFEIVLVASVITLSIVERSLFLRARENEQLALTFAPNALLTFDRLGRVLSISKNAEEWFERSPEQLIGKRLVTLFDNSEELQAASREAFSQGATTAFTTIATRTKANGSLLHLEASIQANTDPTLPYAFVVSLRDVTREVELKAEKKVLIDRSNSHLLVQDEQWNTLQCSDAWIEFSGYSREETLAKDFHDFLHPDDRERGEEDREALLKGELGNNKDAATYRLITKAGYEKIVRLRSLQQIEEGKPRILLTILDVTELENARATAESYLTEGTNSYIIQGENFDLVFASPAARELAEHTDEQEFLSGHRAWPDRSEEKAQALRKELLALPVGEVKRFGTPERLRTYKGNFRFVTRTVRWFNKIDGTGRLLMISFEDVTELVNKTEQLEQALNASEAYLAADLSAYTIQDEQFNFIYLGERTKELFGYIIGQELSYTEIFPEFTPEKLQEQRKMLGNLPTGVVHTDESPVQVATTDGKTRYILRHQRWFDNPTGEGRLLWTSTDDVTELEQKKRALEKLSQRSLAYLKASRGHFTIQDEAFQMVYASEVAQEVFGAKGMHNHSPKVTSIWPDTDEAYWEAHRAEIRALETGQAWHSPGYERIKRADGIERMITRRRHWFANPTGEGRLLYTEVQDWTELLAERSFNEQLLDQSPAIILTENAEWQITSCSEAWIRLLGYSREETLGKAFLEFFVPEQREVVRIARERFLDGKDTVREFHAKLVAKSGKLHDVRLNIRSDTSISRWQLILTVTDVTDLLQTQDKLTRLVDHDALTGLLSRRWLNSHFVEQQRLQDAALFILDVDHFKSVNDSYGHDAGDALLKAYAETLTRLTEDAGCAIRLGGEEFAVIRPWSDWKEAYTFAETLRIALAETKIEVNGRHIQRTASIGYAVLLKDGDLARAMKLADMMQREAKDTGRNKVVGADPETLARLEDRGVFITNKQVQEALERGELIYFVQPIWNTNEKAIEGFEALIRWQKPDGSMVMPGQFVEVLGEVIREPYYRNIKAKLRQDVVAKLGDFPDAYVSFNYKLEQIGYTGAAAAIDAELSASRDHPDRQLVIEISESSMTDRMDRAALLSELEALKEFGYLIALDDFGVESSNIKRLQDYPIDIVKLDKSLVADLELSTKKRSTMTALAIMLMNLKLKIVVEGVETVWQAKTLDIYRLVVQQGYLHARPMRPEEVAPNLAFIGADLTRAERMTEEQLNSLQRLMG